jgi:Carboxypeptidase regulatory-like domain
VALFFLCLVGPTWLRAETISGTIQDSSGAVIAGAQIEITGGDLAQPVVLASDGLGKFASSELKTGTYSVRVTRDGFEPLVKTVDLRGPIQLQLTLANRAAAGDGQRPRKNPGVWEF